MFWPLFTRIHIFSELFLLYLVSSRLLSNILLICVRYSLIEKTEWTTLNPICLAQDLRSFLSLLYVFRMPWSSEGRAMAHRCGPNPADCVQPSPGIRKLGLKITYRVGKDPGKRHGNTRVLTWLAIQWFECWWIVDYHLKYVSIWSWL